MPPLPNCNLISGGGTTVTCSGNVSTGVLLDNGAGPYSVLNVNNLTADITPASGVSGIAFTSYRPVTLNVDTGSFAIITIGDFAVGVLAGSQPAAGGGPPYGGSVTINATANITTSGDFSSGIQGTSQNEAMSITSAGRILTYGDNAIGILGGSVGGPVTITSTGDIRTEGAFAAGIAAATIGSYGTTDGAITINSYGNIVTTGNNSTGIKAASTFAPITLTSFGNVSVTGNGSFGIEALSGGDVAVTSFGNVTTGPDSANGISALSLYGSATITSFGKVETGGDSGVGLSVSAGQTAKVYAYGDVSTHGNSTNNDLALCASFESAPAGVGPFTINTKLDDVMGLVSAGVDVITGNDSVLRFSYDAQLGETTQIQSVGIKGSAKF